MAVQLAPAEFISDVDKYMQGQVVENKILELEQHLRAYKQREQQLRQRKERLLGQLPELKTTLEAVTGLIEKRDSDDVIHADFELTDNIYAKAALQHVDSVNLWLGANVMVEYPLDEAQELLQTNLDACKSSLEAIEKEMESTKDSITITEVSMARVFNWDVEQRRKAKAAAGTNV